jgi:hypothetical protein
VRAPADFLCDHVQRPKEIAKEQSAALAFILKKCAGSHNEGQPDIEYEQPNSKDRNWQKLLHPYGVTHPTGYRSDRPHLDRPLNLGGPRLYQISVDQASQVPRTAETRR